MSRLPPEGLSRACILAGAALVTGVAYARGLRRDLQGKQRFGFLMGLSVMTAAAAYNLFLWYWEARHYAAREPFPAWVYAAADWFWIPFAVVMIWCWLWPPRMPQWRRPGVG